MRSNHRLLPTLLLIICLTVSSGMGIFAFIYLKKQVAAVAILQSEDDLIRGNFRNALAAMSISLGPHFEQIRFKAGNQEFIYPPELKSKPFSLRYRIAEDIKPDGFTAPLGKVLLVVDVTALGVLNLALIMLGVAASTLLARYMRRRTEELARKERQLALASLATQVAHDIRAPLAVLEVTQEELARLPKAEATMAQDAMIEIKQIADTLLTANSKYTSAGGFSLKPTPIAALLKEVFERKSLQFKADSNLRLQFDVSPLLLESKIVVDQLALRRVLSNLLNNAIEATGSSGRVTLAALIDRGQICIKIEDDGPGIPKEILEKLGEKGLTYAKNNGNGLGIAHAFECCRRWGATLDFISQPDRGTCVAIRFPIGLADKQNIRDLDMLQTVLPTTVLVDDSIAIRKVWAIVAAKKGRPFLSFSSSDELLATINFLPKNSIFYIDSDLGKDAPRGEDLSKQLHQLGYKDLFLATGYNASRFQGMQWITGVVGKTPPWPLN